VKKRNIIEGIDPLYIIFEKNLYDQPFENPEDLVYSVVREYMQLMSDECLIVPDKCKDMILETLMDEVYDMLRKKTYGCLSIDDYRKNLDEKKENDRSLARERYSQLKKLA
jgi:hypothetical protein